MRIALIAGQLAEKGEGTVLTFMEQSPEGTKTGFAIVNGEIKEVSGEHGPMEIPIGLREMINTVVRHERCQKIQRREYGRFLTPIPQ